ncbi:MAG: hypothetical protein LBT38_05890 [Deltaproteobacteria bacterium]|jgi:hypothetical protein|nr:hypothetical protein [Deltaproteobacteria bacterium]
MRISERRFFDPHSPFVLFLGLWLGIWVWVGANAWAGDPPPLKKYDQRAEAKTQSLIKKFDIQTELPLIKTESDSSERKGFVIQIILFSLFGVVVALILFIVGQSIYRHLKSAPPPEPLASPNADLGQRLEEIGQNSRRVAKNGQYAEAIHQLLLRSLEEFQKRKKVAWPSSLTSREILARLKLGPPVEPALAFMVAKVEISHFGPYEPQETDYKACLDNFETLIKGLKAEGSA